MNSAVRRAAATAPASSGLTGCGLPFASTASSESERPVEQARVEFRHLRPRDLSERRQVVVVDGEHLAPGAEGVPAGRGNHQEPPVWVCAWPEVSVTPEEPATAVPPGLRERSRWLHPRQRRG